MVLTKPNIARIVSTSFNGETERFVLDRVRWGGMYNVPVMGLLKGTFWHHVSTRLFRNGTEMYMAAPFGQSSIRDCGCD